MKTYWKLRLWWMDNWMKAVMIGVAIPSLILIVAGLWAMTKMESFYLMMNLAQVPMQLLLAFVSAIIFVFLYSHFFTGRFTAGRKANVKSESVNVRFKDVVGLDNAKREAMEVVQLLRDRQKLKAIGGQIVKGLLFFGPPGTGKTYLAKAIATEADIPFISMSGSEFVEVFVGVGASRVRSLFKRARLLAQGHGACIVFIDEIDALAQGRKFSAFGSSESDSTLNQVLVEMDGLGDLGGNVLVIGATNAPEEVLDKALLRPGRFDLHIHLGRPNLKERIDLFRHYLKRVKCDPSLDVGRLARRCVMKSPADIMNIVKESALIATREKKDRIEYGHLSKAIERIDLGIVRNLTMGEKEKESVAFHEAGHLMVIYLQHPTDDVFKASIIARGGALGVVYHNPREERHTTDRNELLGDIKASLAGYVAEKIRYGATTTGVSSDFSAAMARADAMVWMYGMGTNGFIGNYDLLVRSFESKLSDSMKDQMNRETQAILNTCAKEVEEFLRAHWDIVERFVKALVEKGELEYDEIHAIFAEFGKARELVPVETVTLDGKPTL